MLVRRLLVAVPAVAASLFQRPATAQSLVRAHLVFFDENSAELRDSARQIVARAADAALQLGAQQLEIGGHADAAERAQILSAQRADAVAAELRRSGFPAARLRVVSFGASRPMVQATQGRREPLNRRVEIVIR